MSTIHLGWRMFLKADAFVNRPRIVKPEEADRPEQLVPIRLEFDVDHHKMRDTFVWNLSGTYGPFLTKLSTAHWFKYL